MGLVRWRIHSEIPAFEKSSHFSHLSLLPAQTSFLLLSNDLDACSRRLATSGAASLHSIGLDPALGGARCKRRVEHSQKQPVSEFPDNVLTYSPISDWAAFGGGCSLHHQTK